MDEIYALAAEELRGADTPSRRRKAFRQALLRAYEAGIDAQRELTRSFPHDRPTPVPAAPEAPEDTSDPGTVPLTPPRLPGPPTGTFEPNKS